MTAYYNEIDSHAAAWLRNLIAAGHIAPGVVDTRSIEDVRPSDLAGFDQCHFFAGVGVWSYALRSAGWPDDRPVWTGSCPCQPFSTAGKGAAFADERHLWPAFHHLIKERRPISLFGEQVASKDADAWIDLVQDDMEALGYAFGAVPFPSASVGAPHIRDRLYWVANAGSQGLAKRECNGRIQRKAMGAFSGQASFRCGSPGMVAYNNERAIWSEPDWIACTDGKWRPVELGTFPLAYGDTARVGRLRAYGNAINASQARIFIESVMESL